MDDTVSLDSPATNRSLLLCYLAPYVAYVALASLRLGDETTYMLRLTVVPALLCWAWQWYPPLVGPGSPLASVGIGALAGVAGTAAWVSLLSPFVQTHNAPWSGLSFGLRLVAAGLVVPVFEELLMRGYVFRVALQWDQARRQGVPDPLGAALDERSLAEVTPGAWSPLAVAVSTAAFAAGHQVAAWPASVAYGLLMSGLWIVRRDLLSCVVAHGVTNVGLALFVWNTGQWGLW